ncbi:MAG: hypothetical protein DMG96_04275 [Acidobacteria bacterium]|nr:MAG: hypothetical protein DMG96_04275 [Acidobacteriota bacterium]
MLEQLEIRPSGKRKYPANGIFMRSPTKKKRSHLASNRYCESLNLFQKISSPIGEAKNYALEFPE